MGEALVFPPFIGFSLIVLNILLILTLLVFSLFKLQNKKDFTQKTDTDIIDSIPFYEYGFTLFEKSMSVFSDKSRLNDFYNTLSNIFLKITNADGAMLLLANNSSENFAIVSFEGNYPPPTSIFLEKPLTVSDIEAYYKNNNITFSSHIFSTIVKEKKTTLITDLESNMITFEKLIDKSLKNTHEYDVFFQASSYIYVPIILTDNCIGIIALSKNQDSIEFTELEFESAKKMSSFSNISLENIYANEEIAKRKSSILQDSIAQNLQTKLYCSKIPLLRTLDIGSFFISSKGICSDYFDIFVPRKNRICVVLGDVIGKGMNSLMVITMIRAILGIVVNTAQTSATILTWINKGLMLDAMSENFASLSLISYNPENSSLQCANAGENVVLVYDKRSNTWEFTNEKNDPMGISKTSVFTNTEKNMTKDTIIVLYTDGLLEAKNEMGNRYSLERLQKNIEKNANFSSKTITEQIKHDIMEYVGSENFYDDASLVIIKQK